MKLTKAQVADIKSEYDRMYYDNNSFPVFDNDAFLKESDIIKRNNGLYLLYDKIHLLRTNDEDAKRFLELKSEL